MKYPSIANKSFAVFLALVATTAIEGVLHSHNEDFADLTRSDRVLQDPGQGMTSCDSLGCLVSEQILEDGSTDSPLQCYPPVSTLDAQNLPGRDNAFSVFVGGDYELAGGNTTGTGVEGRLYVHGMFYVKKYGTPGGSQFGSFYAGSNVLPSDGSDCVVVIGDLIVATTINLFNQDPSMSCNVVVRGGGYDARHARTDGYGLWWSIGMDDVHTNGIVYEDANYVPLGDYRTDLFSKSRSWSYFPTTQGASVNWDDGRIGGPGRTTFNCSNDANEIQVFNIQYNEGYMLSNVQDYTFSNECGDKTILINVHRSSQITAWAKPMYYEGANEFPSCMNQNIMWNFRSTTRIGSSCTDCRSGWHGSVLVRGNMIMDTSGIFGRTMMTGDLTHEGPESKFYNYPFDPPLPIPYSPPSAMPSEMPVPPTPMPIPVPSDMPSNAPNYSVFIPEPAAMMGSQMDPTASPATQGGTPTDMPVPATPASDLATVASQTNPTISPTASPTTSPFASTCSADDSSTPTNMGALNMCLRSSLGYSYSTPNGSVTTYQEVNFIETLIRIEYDMTSGFCVDTFSVAPKERELTTIFESYEDALIAYLCIGPQHPEYNNGANNEDVTLSNGVVYNKPKEVTEYNTSNPNPNPKKFNQGALINVCVQVKDEFAAQDIVLKSLLEFSWTRSGGTTFDSSIGGGSGTNTITQVAIAGSAPAGNFLTSYVSDNCLNRYWCDFASVLFAQFYNTDGSVSGSGDASLQFKTIRRRLGKSENREDRRLQQDDPGPAGMDISIDVERMSEGPGDLKTAGGTSLGATAFVSAAVAFFATLFS